MLHTTNLHSVLLILAENILQRVISALKLLWAFILALLDDLTDGLNSFCKDSLDISKVLLFERALLTQQQKKVRGDMLFWVHVIIPPCVLSDNLLFACEMYHWNMFGPHGYKTMKVSVCVYL